MKRNLVGKILGKIKIFVQDFVPIRTALYGNKILYKNLDLTQDIPNKISFHFLWVKMLPKNLPKIFTWPEMCPRAVLMGTKSCTKILNFSTRFSCENLAVEDFVTLLMGKKSC